MSMVGDSDTPEALAVYNSVDTHPNTAMLVNGMDTTTRWPAVRQLRAWERDKLRLVPGEHLLDVGCGPGHAAISLATELAPTGSVLGLDASEAMVIQARRRAADGAAAVEFRVADALALPVATGTMDACRSERMLQWVCDIGLAATELVRVLRPGGRLVVIDTDWRSLMMELPEAGLAESVTKAMEVQRGPGFSAGRQLLNLLRSLGLLETDCTAATHVWTAWDPDAGPEATGFFPIRIAVPQLVDGGFLDRETADRFLAQIEQAAREDRCFMSFDDVCRLRP